MAELTRPDVDPPTGPAPADLVVEDLVVGYGDFVAVREARFGVKAGEVFGLLGPNGAGKTTAVRILTTIIPPDAGRARVLGYDVRKDADAVRARIGLAGQYAAVDDNLTGAENLRLIGRLAHLPRSVIPARADELLERFELTDAAGRPVRTYSGGMRRRLDLAAALVHRPPVLFLDEPTTGLDPRSRRALWAVIGELVAEGTTLLFTTQYLEEADRLADRIAVVDNGRVIAEGSAAELKSRLGTTLEVSLSGDQQADRAVRVLAPIGTAPPQREGSLVRLEVTDGSRALVDVLSVLVRDDLAPVSLAIREASLDDVFLAITGRPAEPAEQAQEAAGPARGAR